ncbi:hypothetical protein ABMA27_004333 [Loxostege sticticalis]|uniref:FHA domain-containing protein n=1 Tax=Loxostege sticticalis TaxID=481309 RepID=A0ABR3HNF1_LOXSC
MAKWTLCRQTFGSETYTFSEGDEVSLGRGLNNTITLSSLVISRSHCVMNFQRNQILITDLNSSNGIYVGTKRIPANVPYAIKESDVIGMGWTIGVPLGHVVDKEKFVFKVVKEPLSLINRITFQSDDEFDNIEEKIATLAETKIKSNAFIEASKPQLKRKIEFETDSLPRIIDPNEIKKENNGLLNDDEQIIHIISDSDTELNAEQQETVSKKPKLETVHEETHKESSKNKNETTLNLKKTKLETANNEHKENCKIKNEINLKSENEYLEYEAFNVKQEYSGYDDEAIAIDSDSDSESEHWYLRLSQSSPGKPFMKVQEKISDNKPEDSSYSQMDDDLEGIVAFLSDDNDYLDEAVSIPPQPPDEENEITESKMTAEKSETVQENANAEKYNIEKLTHVQKEEAYIEAHPTSPPSSGKDEIDGFSSKELCVTSTTVTVLDTPAAKKTQMIEPLHQIKRRTSHTTKTIQDNKSKKSSKNDTKSKHSSKTQISNSQKEERKRKLKELAQKGKDEPEPSSSKADKQNSSKSVNVKVTSSNRQAFLTTEPVVKPVKRKESPLKSKTDKAKKETLSPEDVRKNKSTKQTDDIENDKKGKTEKKEHKHDNSKSKDSQDSKCNGISNTSISETRIPLKSLKPMTESEISNAQLLPREKKKSVRFSEAPPEVHYFEIEPGNKMKKTSLVKTSLVDTRQMPSFSLERITLMKILRWNPHWLEEQINNNEPPPILGHNNLPLALFHSFTSHNQYVQLIGDLLLMEIWECLSIAYTKIRSQTVGLRMVINSLPPVPTQERFFDTFNLSVDVSVPVSEVRNLPRVGEILLVSFGQENARHQRFFFVHNLRCHPSPSGNRNAFYNISLQATFSDKMRSLKPGEVMMGVRLAYINKELSLFESMAYMAGSPLSEAILRPEPRHFARCNNPAVNITNPWTTTLNSSQHTAVASSVSAALGDRPCIQMVQGPPGTGKSSVICAIVMSYFYDANGKKQQNRGKILICATSNAAVDELVIRLLNIRQTLPTSERFRMVRVGRAEAMHPRAREVSSQQLAQREAARAQHDPQHRPGLSQEISHLEAKINMWKSAAQDAAAKGQDPMRVAYCQGRISDLVKRIALLRGGGGGGDELRPEQLVHAERRYIEGADIVVTTLASAHNHKMKGLKRRIALCIVDEAGQAIEPEALIPLTLDVTRLTLIGDPQQLPGYICSQRAKKHGLAESLFSRLASCAEAWRQDSPVILLHEQYRMHDQIADYPNRAFYASQIRTVARPRPELPVPPYCIVGISSGDKGQNAMGANEMEAWGVSRLVVALGAGLRARGLSLAVITPYNAHKELIKKNLKMLIDPVEAQVEVNTVDSFQGQERDVVVVSLARSSGVGFLTDAGRMNVMLTRARHALLVCLNPHAVLKNHQWRTLLEDAHRRQLFRTLPYKMCQPTGLFSNEEILKHF